MDDYPADKLPLSYKALTAVGPVPTAALPRWCEWTQAPFEGLPPVKQLVCHRTDGKLIVDGRLDKECWKYAVWSEPFGAVADGAPVHLETQVAFLWDERCLYAAFKVEDPDIRGSMTGFHDHVYLHDEDVELFIEGEGLYYELGVNPLNTVYEIRWSWVEPLVEKRDWATLERLLSTPNFLYFLKREGERLGRHGDLDWELPGLEHAVHLDGTLNRPEIRDKSWTVEFALPWEGLAQIMAGRTLPPKPGDSLRVMGYRAHHGNKESGKTAVGWSWGAMGNENIHIPERWNSLVLADTPPSD